MSRLHSGENTLRGLPSHRAQSRSQARSTNVFARLGLEQAELSSMTGGELLRRLQMAAQNPDDEGAGTVPLTREELEELDDDPDAGLDDELDNPLSSRKRAHQQVVDSLGEDEDEDSAEAAPSRKRGRPFNPTFTSSTSTAIRSTLPQRRPRTQPGGPQAEPTSTMSASHPADPPNSSPVLPPPPSTPPRHASSDTLPFTPFKIKHTGTKPCMRDATPTTQPLLDTACTIFRVYLSTVNAFPDLATQTSEIKAAFRTACADVHATRRALRAERDLAYSNYIVGVVKQRTSQMRGEVKRIAENLVPFHYQLVSLSTGGITDLVRRLLDRAAFTFEVPDERKGKYGHPIIGYVIAGMWFKHAKAEGRGEYSSQFHPMPFPIIALAATAIECALMAWTDGTCNKAAHEFSETPYSDVYSRHMQNLKDWRAAKPTDCASCQEALWNTVWRIAGVRPPAAAIRRDFDDADLTSD